MSNLMQLPANYETAGTIFKVPGEGPHECVVKHLNHEDGQVKATFAITGGPDKGLAMDQTYGMDHPSGVRLFKELMEAVGVYPNGNGLDLDEAVGRKVVVTVAHRQHDGNTYANAVVHEKAS